MLSIETLLITGNSQRYKHILKNLPVCVQKVVYKGDLFCCYDGHKERNGTGTWVLQPFSLDLPTGSGQIPMAQGTEFMVLFSRLAGDR